MKHIKKILIAACSALVLFSSTSCVIIYEILGSALETPSSETSSQTTTTETKEKQTLYTFQCDTWQTAYIYYASTDKFDYDKYKNCEYQINFSYRTKTSGTWTLNTRIANGAIIEKVKNGTYTGDPWNNGEVVLTADGEKWNTITISNATQKGTTGTFSLNVYSVNSEIGVAGQK